PVIRATPCWRYQDSVNSGKSPSLLSPQSTEDNRIRSYLGCISAPITVTAKAERRPARISRSLAAAMPLPIMTSRPVTTPSPHLAPPRRPSEIQLRPQPQLVGVLEGGVRAAVGTVLGPQGPVGAEHLGDHQAPLAAEIPGALIGIVLVVL